MSATEVDNPSVFAWNGRCLCEVPERRPSFGAYICARPGCLLGLEAGLRDDPGLTIVVKWGVGSRTITHAADFVREVRANGIEGFAAYVDREDDEQYVREVFVMHDPARDGAW